MRAYPPFAPNRDTSVLIRRWHPSSMSGNVVDRASHRLQTTQHSLSDLTIWKLAELLHSDLDRKAWYQVKDEIKRRMTHATHEEDLDDIQLLVSGKVVSL